MWDEVVKYLGGTAILIGAVAWLIRSITVHFLSKDIALFKQDLKTGAEIELTRLKAQLEIETLKTQIKLSSLQEKRIESIKQLHDRLIAFSDEADCFTVEPIFGDEGEVKQKADKFIDSYFEFYKFFRLHAIYLPREIENQIMSLHSEHFEAALHICYSKGTQSKEAINKLHKDSKSITTKSNSIRNNLAAEFRKLLGVDS